MDELDLAKRLIDYSRRGLIELDTKPLITSSIVNRLVCHDQFPSDPHAVAAETARHFGDSIFDDLYALPMAVMSGLPQFYNISEVQSNAIRVCRTTHSNKRIIKSASFLASVIALLLQVNLYILYMFNDLFKAESN